MSYRAFKRLLGETSLERKCRFLFGAGILVLITLSFWFHAYRTEDLAYDQATTTCRLLVNPILAQQHLVVLKLKGSAAKTFNPADMFILKEPGKEYQYHFLQDNKIVDPWERDQYKEYLKGEDGKQEDIRLRPSEQVLLYYTPVRAGKACLECHQKIAQEKGQGTVAENDVLGVLRIRMPTNAIEDGVHRNRAILMATALGTAL